MELSKLIEYHYPDCSKLQYGTCSTRSCLVRGGWKSGEDVNYDLATCAHLETVHALRRLRAIEEASEMPPEPQTFLNGPEGDTWVRWTQYDALRLHAQHLASKELK